MCDCNKWMPIDSNFKQYESALVIRKQGDSPILLQRESGDNFVFYDAYYEALYDIDIDFDTALYCKIPTTKESE